MNLRFGYMLQNLDSIVSWFMYMQAYDCRMVQNAVTMYRLRLPQSKLTTVLTRGQRTVKLCLTTAIDMTIILLCSCCGTESHLTLNGLEWRRSGPKVKSDSMPYMSQISSWGICCNSTQNEVKIKFNIDIGRKFKLKKFQTLLSQAGGRACLTIKR